MLPYVPLCYRRFPLSYVSKACERREIWCVPFTHMHLFLFSETNTYCMSIMHVTTQCIPKEGTTYTSVLTYSLTDLRRANPHPFIYICTSQTSRMLCSCFTSWPKPNQHTHAHFLPPCAWSLVHHNGSMAGSLEEAGRMGRGEPSEQTNMNGWARAHGAHGAQGIHGAHSFQGTHCTQRSVHTHTYIYIYRYIYIYIYMAYIHIYIYIDIHIYTHTYTHLSLYLTNKYMCFLYFTLYISIYIHIYIVYVYIYIYRYYSYWLVWMSVGCPLCNIDKNQTPMFVHVGYRLNSWMSAFSSFAAAPPVVTTSKIIRHQLFTWPCSLLSQRCNGLQHMPI